MAKMLELIEIWLINHRVITLKHIYREGNKMADLLANNVVDYGLTLYTGSIRELATETQFGISKQCEA